GVCFKFRGFLIQKIIPTDPPRVLINTFRLKWNFVGESFWPCPKLCLGFNSVRSDSSLCFCKRQPVGAGALFCTKKITPARPTGVLINNVRSTWNFVGASFLSPCLELCASFNSMRPDHRLCFCKRQPLG